MIMLPRAGGPAGEGAEEQARDDGRGVGFGDDCIGDAYQKSNQRTGQSRMDWQGYVGGNKTDGEPAEECSRESRGFIGKLHGEHEQDVGDSGGEAE